MHPFISNGFRVESRTSDVPNKLLCTIRDHDQLGLQTGHQNVLAGTLVWLWSLRICVPIGSGTYVGE